MCVSRHERLSRTNPCRLVLGKGRSYVGYKLLDITTFQSGVCLGAWGNIRRIACVGVLCTSPGRNFPWIFLGSATSCSRSRVRSDGDNDHPPWVKATAAEVFVLVEFFRSWDQGWMEGKGVSFLCFEWKVVWLHVRVTYIQWCVMHDIDKKCGAFSRGKNTIMSIRFKV